MSGIAGLVFASGRPVTADMLDRLAAATPHLGIDGVGRWHDGPAGFVRFALHTTPEATTEAQPHADRASGAVILFDGRLDNRDALREALGPADPGAAAPDCVIVLAAHGRFGDELPQRLVGDYALAIWQPGTRRLFAARSPVGMRPFLWTRQDDFFAFASEPSTLIRGLGLPKRLNEGAIGEHLAARFVTDTETLWDGIYRLPPGHALCVDDGRVRSWCWNAGPFADHMDLSESEHVEQFRALFDQALIATTRSERPVAAQLSGGLDSSAVVCRVDQLVRDGRIGAMVEAVSARYPGEICDEGEWIAEVEAQCGIRSTMVEGAPFDAMKAATWCAQTLHLPLRPNTAGTVESVCRHLNDRGLRVALTGEGGDDWLAGSRAHWPDLFRRGRWGGLASEAGAAGAGWGRPVRATRAILAGAVGPLLSRSRRERLLRPHLDFSQDTPPWLSADWARRIDLADRWADAPRPPALGSFSQTQRYRVYSLARRHINMDNVFSYAASRGIEFRHPFHDLRLTRFLIGAAGDMLRRGDSKKYLLREAMRDVLPERIRQRTDKANISAPIIDAVTERLEKRPFRDMHGVRNGWVDAAVLEQIQAEHLVWRGAGGGAPPMSAYAAVWNMVATDMWLEYAFENERGE